MKRRWFIRNAFGAAVFLAGCATDTELTQKEKDRMAREQQRQDQKQAQAEARRMREATQSGQRRGMR